MSERFSLKDHLFNVEKVSYLGGLLEVAIAGFDRARFEASVLEKMPELELKQRIALIAEVLGQHLDTDFARAAEQIRSALPPPLDPTLTDDDFGDFIFAPFGKYVEDRGIDHYDVSMDLLKELTMRFSMEGSVRPFIDHRPNETMRLFESWARDDSYHVRRLVSESTRPALPWAPRIGLDVRHPLPLLDVLHTDPTRYVTRSVANHLNDISKIDSGLVIETLDRWRRLGEQSSDELDWMTRHALRTLLKRGDPDAMRVLGYSPEARVRVGEIELASPVVGAGESLDFSVDVAAEADELLMVDYAIDFVKKNGERKPRVFKLKKLSLAREQTTTLSKRHPLRANATTYRLYPGQHRLSILVNGRESASTEFEVTTR